MKRWLFICALFLSISLHAVPPCGDAAFSNEVLRLVDEGPHVYLFRGKMPTRHGKFCYECLSGQFREALVKCGKQLDPDYKLLCISLLNCSEAKERHVEYEWFRQHPEKGCLWCYPLFGNAINPCYVAPGFRRMYLQCDPDGVRALVSQIRALVTESRHKGDLVIYLHCRVGKDRTGEAMACYMMQFQGYSYQRAVAYCKEVADRKLKGASMNAIRWHAYYLRDIVGCQTIGEID